MSVEIALRKYEDYLLGKAPFSLKGADEFEKEDDEVIDERTERERRKRLVLAKEKDALEIVRYAITKILCWTPQEAMESLTPEIAEQLYLDKMTGYIRYPKELSRDKDYTWMIHKAFPKETRYDATDQILQLYQRVKSGSLKRFPKRIFESEDGAYKLTVLLKDYISKNLSVHDVSELYEIFGDNGLANQKMREAKLYYAYRERYDTPLDYLHKSLDNERSDFLYNFYRYMMAVNEVKKLEAKEKKSSAKEKVS